MARARSEGGGLGWIVLLAIVMLGALAKVSEEIGAASIPIWFAAIGGMAWALRGPLGRALAERIAGRRADEVAVLPEETYAELDEMRRRLYELEERVDFSERLLATRPSETVRSEVPEI